jgi:ubiquinone/menaquinone biosynthesis C-methylase UbiE
MHLDWRLQVVEPESERHLRTVVGFGPEARRLIADVPPDAKVVLGVAIDTRGTVTGVMVPPGFARAAREAGMQLRIELIADGYQKRYVDFGAIHGVREEDLRMLVQAIDLRDGMRVLDLGCSCGAVSAAIIVEADRRGIDVDLVLCDLHEPQLRSVPEAVQARARRMVVGDARDLPFPDGHFDAVVTKMMLHEVPIADQPLVCEQVFRVLRPGGIFVVWQVMPQDGAVQDAFAQVLRLKNALAGYESIVRDLYLLRLDELLRMLREAGFSDARSIRQVGFRQSTLARRDSELGGSDTKLARLNAYCRSVISPEVARRIDLTDSGDDIQFWIPNHIVVAHKPR